MSAAARPLAPAQSNALPPPVRTAAPAPTTPPRLLLVDDSAVARAKLRKLFDSAGYQVQLAKDGVDALEQLTAAGPGHFALMITDVEMPRMNGLELIQTLASGGSMPAMPILTISGHDNLAAELAACPAVRGVFRKPWQDEQLLTQVRALVGANGVGALLH